MTTPSSGPINAQHINTELGRPSTQLLSLNDSAVRTLAGRPSGTISYNDLRGKSSFSASGGNYVVSPGNGYTYHTFTGPGSFVFSGSKSFDILVVGAGGGSKDAFDSRCGGGGGGGVAYWPSVSLAAGTYSITVGTGSAGSSGGDSVFGPGTSYSVVGKGGGLGGGGPRGNQTSGVSGGSGGGGAGFDQNTASGSATQPSQNPGRSGLINSGNPGGPARSGYATSEGGGGAGGAGNRTTATYGATGGHGIQYSAFTGNLIGIPSLNPYSGYYGGGGDSADSTNTTRPLGGGGACPTTATVSNHQGQNGINYLGGGASGGGSAGPVSTKAGGHGIVVVRYPT